MDNNICWSEWGSNLGRLAWFKPGIGALNYKLYSYYSYINGTPGCPSKILITIPNISTQLPKIKYIIVNIFVISRK